MLWKSHWVNLEIIWIGGLSSILQLKMPRRYTNFEINNCSVDLQVFTDASDIVHLLI